MYDPTAELEHLNRELGGGGELLYCPQQEHCLRESEEVNIGGKGTESVHGRRLQNTFIDCEECCRFDLFHITRRTNITCSQEGTGVEYYPQAHGYGGH